MNVSALERNVTAAHLPLEKLATSTQVPEREKIAEVSRQFEAVLLRQILSQAQKPLFKSSLVSSGSSNAIYQDMVTQQLADRISHGGSFGFAKVLEKQLAVQHIKREPVPTGAPGAAMTARSFQALPERKTEKISTEPARPRIQPGKRI